MSVDGAAPDYLFSAGLSAGTLETGGNQVEIMPGEDFRRQILFVEVLAGDGEENLCQIFPAPHFNLHKFLISIALHCKVL
jgi:hypothetical protein